MPSVAIIGGGVTGLAAAYHLSRTTDAEIHLFEKEPRLGGKIATKCVDGFLIESSADAIFTQRPGCMELIRELDLESDIVTPQASEFGMLMDGRLWRVPPGLVKFGAISAEALASAEFLSDEAKCRVAKEESIPAGFYAEESIASFFRRRYGLEFSQKVAEPLLAGTRSGLPEELSMKACLPSYVKMERDHGSLTAAMRNASPRSAGPSFVSFRGGIQGLTDGLSQRLGRTVIHREAALPIESVEHRYRVNGIEADAILVATPASEAVAIFSAAVPETASLLKNIAASSGAIVTMAFHSSELAESLKGTGFLVPYIERSLINGATWSSSKWPGRAPDGACLVRVFLGREGILDVADHTDQELQTIAEEALQKLFEVPATTFTGVERWVRALPQYRLGHTELVDQIEASLASAPGLFVAGQSYRGVGIPDCLSQARDAAVKIAAYL